MGWKYHHTLTSAQRDMLRSIEKDPHYRPKSTRTRRRLKTLIDNGFVVVGKRGRKTVIPKPDESK